MKSGELCVSAKSLAIQDGGESVPPAVGDTVSFTVEGKVSRIEGGEVYVTPMTANGEPLEDAKGKEMPREGDEPSEDSLRKSLEQMEATGAY